MILVFSQPSCTQLSLSLLITIIRSSSPPIRIFK